jgi:protein involved in polysaccharide export with SLBB domain
LTDPDPGSALRSGSRIENSRNHTNIVLIERVVSNVGRNVRFRWTRLLGIVLLSAAIIPLTKAQDASNYKISPNDVLDFRVFQEDDLTAQVRVAGDGTAIFPLIGSVGLAGKTVAEATAVLRQRYLNGYLVNPQVSLIIQTYAKRTFTVLGQVQRPGTYEIVGDQAIGLFEAIGMAGGYTRIADPGNVTIRRRANGQEQVTRVNAKRDKNGLASEITVHPGDIINVGESIF